MQMRLALCQTLATFWTGWRARWNEWASHAQC